MDKVFHIDPSAEIPIYQQLVDSITLAIKKGVLQPEQKLPTVQEVSQRLKIARGTIKRVYDELEHKGLVEKTQGRGTFVRYQPGDSASRKERAMAAIDEMFQKMEEIGLTATEINIFLNLKLRQREEAEAMVKVALVECNPEALSQMAEQVHQLKQIELYSFLFDEVQKYPYKLEEDFDLVITTASHAPYLEQRLANPKKLARVALRLSPECLMELIRLRPTQKVGILSYSQRFEKLQREACRVYAEDVTVEQGMLFGTPEETHAYLQGLDCVLLPVGWEKYCAPETVQVVEGFPGQHILCSYRMDEGSLLYLETKIKNIQDKK
ncbi:MAG: GntR family transcriptional regulator [Oscillospiraceae bacterium]|nr:GntR family transcriptional regulator [Oscillospiraceae bacterium]